MNAPRIVAIADAGDAAGSAGAQLAFDLGRFARACNNAGVPWALWLRTHGWTAERWRGAVRPLSWLAGLGGALGVSAPVDGPEGWHNSALGQWAARVHVPAATRSNWSGGDGGAPRWVACHGLAEVGAALAAGAERAVLSPIWPTASKPDAKDLGVELLRAACDSHPGRVVALGGIDATTAAQALGAGAAAVA
ncbi:MAG: thiamine phosphate synthase, partial [Deltaproteobacteria bacterium]|nr:thiamine phosphate synthase [Deltaproteobacteria bacterium]